MIKAFIPAKGISKRCPNKNLLLLPHVLETCKDILDVTVITDSYDIFKICETYNVDCYLEDCSDYGNEFSTVYNYLSVTKRLDSIDEFIVLPTTQPIRSNSAISNIVNCNLDKYDVVTTYINIPDRSIFLLNEDNSFKYDSYERKGCLCKKIKMIDGAIYKIKTSFLKKLIVSDNINHAFWNESKIKFIENTTNFFLDVDEPIDLEIFNVYKFYYDSRNT